MCVLILPRKDVITVAVDGSIVFDTAIKTEGFEKGTKNISAKALDLQAKLRKTAVEINNTKKDLEDMAKTPIKSKATESIEKNIAKTKEKIKSLYNEADNIGNTKQADLQDMGFGDEHLDEILAQDTAWQKVQSQITATERKLSEYESQLKQVKNAEKDTTGADTAEYKKT